MIKCSYCDKPLTNRKVFCNASHKVMFHREKSAVEIIDKVNKIRSDQGKGPLKTPTKPYVPEVAEKKCKHGRNPNVCSQCV